ncbi:MAG: hypothetical protein ACFFCI_01290 [Promethearchaeota archaeon]
MSTSEDKKQSSHKKVMATVYLKSSSGRSLLQEGIIGNDPVLYQPSSITTQRARLELEKLGFTIEAQGVTLSISGPPELFEKIFDVKISIEEIKRYEPGRSQPLSSFIYRSSKPVMRIKEFEDFIEGIVLVKPGVPFK